MIAVFELLSTFVKTLKTDCDEKDNQHNTTDFFSKPYQLPKRR